MTLFQTDLPSNSWCANPQMRESLCGATSRPPQIIQPSSMYSQHFKI